ncbi:hypothetical protein NA57DRAFT_73719 [Rhizodiscina lignyota]|uniref:N-acetyltransferase domain-containing protein n=1 Tax=Rhizodiscina lignyota TaxID=1504668 RepID=A0A9P4IIQ0_9PEZI|nr:hypothetical protein NA57DRAFT_73719 [Rhizodiscina lignyota]
MSEPASHYEHRRLENDLIALEIFDPDIHSAPFVEVLKADPDAFRYVSFPPIDTKEDFVREVYDKGFRTPTEDCLYVIFDKSAIKEEMNTSSKYAGVLSLNGTSPENAVTELGVMVFPQFQRTHVTTNAIGLALLRLLDPPSAGGLGLRRVEWRTHTGNTASRTTALRMGFEFEGISRWHRAFADAKLGLPVGALEKRNGTKREASGRHTANFSIVWDEWDEKRPKVVELMARKV